MRSGALRQRLVLSAPTTTSDGMGGQLLSQYQPVTTIWGQIDPASGNETLRAEQLTAVITHEILIRYRPNIVPRMRITRVAGGQTFEVHVVINLEMRNHQLTLLCSEVQTVGA
jgi:SPP1 family predicted phage head-tail adaptor